MSQRTQLVALREQSEKEIPFDCTREDFYIALFAYGITPLRVETDGHIIYVIFPKDDVIEKVRLLADPTQEILLNYRLIMNARETWRTFLQLLSDHKNKANG